MTFISLETSPHGRGNGAGGISTGQEVLLVPGWGVSLGGVRCVAVSQSSPSDVLEVPTSHGRAGGCTRKHSRSLAAFVLPVRKDFFQKRGIKTLKSQTLSEKKMQNLLYFRSKCYLAQDFKICAKCSFCGRTINQPLEELPFLSCQDENKKP